MMPVPQVNEVKDHKRKIKRNVRRNTLIGVGIVAGVGVWLLVKKVDDLQDAFVDLTEALNDFTYGAYPLTDPIDLGE